MPSSKGDKTCGEAAYEILGDPNHDSDRTGQGDEEKLKEGGDKNRYDTVCGDATDLLKGAGSLGFHAGDFS